MVNSSTTIWAQKPAPPNLPPGGAIGAPEQERRPFYETNPVPVVNTLFSVESGGASEANESWWHDAADLCYQHNPPTLTDEPVTICKPLKEMGDCARNRGDSTSGRRSRRGLLHLRHSGDEASEIPVGGQFEPTSQTAAAGRQADFQVPIASSNARLNEAAERRTLRQLRSRRSNQ